MLWYYLNSHILSFKDRIWGDIITLQCNNAAVLFIDSGYDVDNRGFSGSIPSKQGMYGPLFYGKAHILQGLCCTEVLADVFNLQEYFFHVPPVLSYGYLVNAAWVISLLPSGQPHPNGHLHLHCCCPGHREEPEGSDRSLHP